MGDVMSFMAQHQIEPQECIASAGVTWQNGRVYQAGTQVAAPQDETILERKAQNIYCYGLLPAGLTLQKILPKEASLSSDADDAEKGCFLVPRFKVCQKTKQDRVNVIAR